MSTLTRILALVGLPLGLLIVGCAMAGEDAFSINGGPNLRQCTSNFDCSGDDTCINEQCLPPGPVAPDSLSLELSPPEASGFARTQFLDIALDEYGQRDSFDLPMPNEYEAVIHGPDGQPISANLAIFGEPRILGRELDVNASLVAGPGNRLIFRLNEGSYVVRIRPSSDDIPGMEVSRFTVRPQAGRIIKEFVLPASYRRLYGEVTSSLSNSEKLSGVSVRAFGEESGLPSTVSVTDENGQYELLLPATEDTTFRLVATPPSDQQPAWGFDQIVGGIDPEQGRQRAIHLEPTSDELRGTGRFQVLGTTLDGRLGAPVPNAFVTLTATVSGAVEAPAYSISGITDSDGFMVVDFEGSTSTQVPLLKARYVVRVVPPINTPYTGRQSVLDLTAARAGFVLEEQVTLPQRTHVTGTVLSRFGSAVSGALLELRPLSPDGRPGDAITDVDGSFEVDLDPGPYLLVIRPRGATSSGELVPVTAQTIEVSEQARQGLDLITVSLGSSLSWVVRGGPQGTTVPGTRAELFVTVAGQVVSLGRSESDADGVCTIVVPQP